MTEQELAMFQRLGVVPPTTAPAPTTSETVNNLRSLPTPGSDQFNITGTGTPTASNVDTATSIRTRNLPTSNPVYGPTNPNSTSGPTNQAPNLQTSLSNIIQTGSASGSGSGTASATTTPTGPQATLVNAATGDRKAVAVGSPEAQALFGQGYTLEGGTPGTGAAAAGGSTTSSFTAPTSQVPGLRDQAAQIKSEMFSSVYGYTPDEWQDLDPATQRQLRNQRVTGLQAQLGNINAAIQTAKEEEATARSQAIESLNTYLKYGVMDQIGSDELAQLAASSGLNAAALTAMGSKAEPMELKEFNGNLYGITFDPDTGEPVMKLIMGGTSGGGGGGSSSNSDFEKTAAIMKDALMGGDIDWGRAFDSTKTSFPDKSDTEINQALGGSVEYDSATGTFGTSRGLAAAGSASSGYEVLPDGTIRIAG